MALGSDKIVFMRVAASPFDMAAEQLASNDLEACGARIWMRRSSASEETLTRVEEGCCGEVMMVAIFLDCIWTGVGDVNVTLMAGCIVCLS